MSDDTSSWKVTAVVLFYMAVALIMVMTNKWVLTTTSLPLTFLFLQLSISVICLCLLSLAPSSSRFHFRPPRWSLSSIISMAPVCTANVVGLVFNILCLQLVDASYFQVARGLTLPFTVVLSALYFSDKPSLPTILSCGLVTWGFTYSFFSISSIVTNTGILATTGAVPDTAAAAGGGGGGGGEAPMLGMIFGVGSGALVAIHAVLVKGALKTLDGRTMDLAWWSNLLSAIALLPAIVISGEIRGIARLIQGTQGSLNAFITGSGITGIVGFLICLAGLLSIKVTSPTTHMFSSAVRSVLQTVLGVYLFGDALNANRIVSIFLILLGSTIYTYYKSRANSSPPSRPLTHSPSKEPLLGYSSEKNRENDPEKGLINGTGTGTGLGLNGRRSPPPR
ncbi:hypothetical protein BCR39DRAFT_493966 [Naematelia encephala]|uniref:GDP-mannose transporter n=1 Tax=Naematelia encephala TaxID=71784 RepID=A0A1Y2B8S3_9TREE|nr:hypothetical protein BCR39DRAFT_493966 [Naematelia encephala]